MRNKSVVSDARQVQLAAELVRLGARLQVLESETSLSRERLLKLYKEVRGESPPKGMLPFSTDWFMSWMPNIHSSLCLDIYRYLVEHTPARGIDAVMTAYRLYLEHLHVNQLEPTLSFTRAWSLVRFFEARMIDTAQCRLCAGRYVVHAMDLHDHYVCGLCHLPSRAGKSRKKATVPLRLAVGALPPQVTTPRHGAVAA
jgi:flagellar transcriptional activator FlhC